MGSLLLGTLRQLRRRWGFGLLVSGTLSLGLAAVLVALAMVQSSLERAAPFPNRARILWLGQASERESDAGVSFPAVERWRQSASSIEDIALFTERGASLTRRGQPAYVTVALVSAPYFRILGLPFRAGRDFSASDDRPSAAPVAIVSQRFLTRHGIPLALAVGQHVELNSVSHEVVGVIAGSGAHPSRETDIWAPILPALQEFENADGANIASALGLLRVGASREQVDRELRTVATLDTNVHLGGQHFEPIVRTIVEHETAGIVPRLQVLVGAAALMLVLSLANLGNAQLTNALRRLPETQVRRALGASTKRILAADFVESLCLSLVGIVGGLTIASIALRLANLMSPTALPEAVTADITAQGVALVTFIGVACAVFLAAISLASESRASRNEHMSGFIRGASSSRRAARSRDALVITQASITVLLLIGAGVLVRSYVHLARTDYGFDARGIYTFRVNRPVTVLTPDKVPAVMAFSTALLRALEGDQIFESVAVSTVTPGQGTRMPTLAQASDASSRTSVGVQSVSTAFFRALRIPILDGRGFDASDVEGGERVAVVSRSLARAVFGSVDVVGRSIQLPDMATSVRVVGVAADIRQNGPTLPPSRELYMPFEQFPLPWTTIVVRSSRGVGEVEQAVRAKVSSVDAGQPIAEFSALEELTRDMLDRFSFYSYALGGFALLSVLLTSIGVYGVLALLVAQRKKEIGVRLSLGATPLQVVQLVMWHGLRLSVIGCVAGLLLAVLLTRSLASLLFGVSPTDAIVVIFALGLVLLLSAVASLVPAIRAASIDPSVTLRADA